MKKAGSTLGWIVKSSMGVFFSGTIDYTECDLLFRW